MSCRKKSRSSNFSANPTSGSSCPPGREFWLPAADCEPSPTFSRARILSRPNPAGLDFCSEPQLARASKIWAKIHSTSAKLPSFVLLALSGFIMNFVVAWVRGLPLAFGFPPRAHSRATVSDLLLLDRSSTRTMPSCRQNSKPGRLLRRRRQNPRERRFA